MTLPMNIFKVMQRLPHRYPFLLIDRILEVEMPNKRLKALKNVTINDNTECTGCLNEITANAEITAMVAKK